MSQRKTQRPDGDLPAHLQKFDQALNTLITPKTQTHNGNHIHAPSLYMQLLDSVRGQQGAGGGVARSMPPLWTDAIDLLNEIDTAVTAWQPQPNGIPPTIGRLNVLRQRPWRPQDIRPIKQITEALTAWSNRITALLEPESVKHVSAACPACGATHIHRKDSAGDTIRQPALQIITNQGCTCLNCKTHWGPGYYLHLCRLLDFTMPEGVLE